MVQGEIVIQGIPTNYHEQKYSGLTKGEATAVVIDVDKYNDMVKDDALNMKVVNCGPIPHDNDKLLKLFKRCKKIASYRRIDPEIILKDGPLSDLFYLKASDFINMPASQKGELPVGIGPGGEYLTAYKASNKTFQTMMIGFEIVDQEIKIGGGIKMDDVIHGNSIFKDYVQKSIIQQFLKYFNTRFTYYITIYEPEKKGFFS